MIEKSQEDIIKNWNNSYGAPVVSIKCITYNHASYIEQALDGFLSQITDFPFEIVVHDDASMDGTAGIIKRYEKKYPLLVKPIYETENQYSKQDGTIRRIMHAKMKGKYIAFCEGDDYWIDVYKLKKQVDFLEQNPAYVMCFTDFDFYYQKKDKFDKDLLKTKESRFPHDYTLEEWIEHPGYVGPMTWMAKSTVMNTYQYVKTSDGTYAQFAHFLASGKVKCLINETTAVYRYLPESASHSENPRRQYVRQKSLCETKLFLANKYGLDYAVKQRILGEYYKKVYKLISILNEEEEKKKAKEYCINTDQRLFMLVNCFAPVRKVMCLLYRWKQRKK